MGCVCRRGVMYVEAWCNSWWRASSEVGDLGLVVPIPLGFNCHTIQLTAAMALWKLHHICRVIEPKCEPELGVVVPTRSVNSLSGSCTVLVCCIANFWDEV